MPLTQKELGFKKRPNEVRHPAYAARAPIPTIAGAGSHSSIVLIADSF